MGDPCGEGQGDSSGDGKTGEDDGKKGREDDGVQNDDLDDGRTKDSGFRLGEGIVESTSRPDEMGGLWR